VSGVPVDTIPLVAHVAGIPVEEVLPGVLACGFVGVRVATISLRNRLTRSAGRRSKAGRASNGSAQ
jgi:hypothetical protein